MDYGPSRRAKIPVSRYHFWDYESDTGAHQLSLLQDQIRSIEELLSAFDPSDFVTWDLAKSPWHIERDWGMFS